jgi:pantetheine-phosphate adenylyltransferase
MRIAVFPGSFDPLTIGHVEIVERALPLFDQIIVAIGINANKKYFFSLEERIAMLQAAFAQHGDKIKIDTYTSLTAQYCRQNGAQYLLRGLRNATDFDYENTIAQLNGIIGHGLETVFLVSKAQYAFYSSTVVRELIRGGEDPAGFLPAAIHGLIRKYLQQPR